MKNPIQCIQPDSWQKIFKAESRGAFTVRENVLGHMQQGNIPSPMDRINGAVAARKATEVMIESALHKTAVVGGVGINSTVVRFTPMEELVKVMDFENRRSKEATWWKELDEVVGALRGRPGQEPVIVKDKPAGIIGKRKSQFPDGDKKAHPTDSP